MAGKYTVTQITAYIKSIFTRDFVLSRITVEGEVSNCKYHSSGHIYFTLKDRSAQINCVMFARDRAGLDIRLANGQQIEAYGQISVYERSGSYQLYVRSARLAGAGELYERFIELKNRLAEMGMFDEIYKKPIPPYVRRLGIVTASTGAAVQDIINISTRRNPYVELVLYPARVQGEGAAATIVRGIRVLDGLGLDCIIVGRGGGSIEDLWAFNEENVAQAIFDADTPIISAVGHETDFTIADFVADLRAPTPSAAAEMANFIYDELEEELKSYGEAFRAAAQRKALVLRTRLTALNERLMRLSPGMQLTHRKERLADISARMDAAVRHKAERGRMRLDNASDSIRRSMDEKLRHSKDRLRMFAAALEGASPLKKMSGGYGYLADSAGRAVSSVESLAPGDIFRAYVSDGCIEAGVISIERNGTDNG